MPSTLPHLTNAAIQDVLSRFGIPTNLISQIYQEVLDNRAKDALDILLCEIRQGSFQNVHQHDLISILARYQRDAMEGVARNNLELLAKTIKGMADHRELVAPNFLKYANILSTLSKDEIYVLATMVKSAKEQHTSLAHIFDDTETPATITSYNKMDPGKSILNEKYNHIQQALVRTGLVQMHSVGMTSYDNDSTMRYNLTPLMEEIIKYTDNFFIQHEKIPEQE